jgi:hypothetical protein
MPFPEAKQPKIHHRDGSDRHCEADEMQALHGWKNPFSAVHGAGDRAVEQPLKEVAKHKKLTQVYRIGWRSGKA